MNEAVLDAVERHALTPEAVEQVIALNERDDVRDRQVGLERELKDTDKRLSTLVAIMETGGDAQSVLARVRQLEARKREISQELRSLQPIPRLERAVIEDRLGEWRRLLRQSTTQARAVLQRVLQGRLTFTPRPDGGYDFCGPTRFDKQFTGIVVEPPAWIGFGEAPNFGPEDTLDSDYARLLERAYEQVQKREKNGKGDTSPTIPSWNHIVAFLQDMAKLQDSLGSAA